ncbi:MAG: DUF2493 domain-containing protein [Clostridia bacterium]|nr:DUF2493 domain-containing protein [Clostridia bacterium]
MDINERLMRSLKQTAEMFGIKEEEYLDDWESELPAPKKIANGKPYKILVCGGRHFESYILLKVVLGKLIEKFYIDISKSELVSGHCQGADMLGEKYAEEYGVSVKRFPADWEKYKRKAGPIRNKQMIDYISGFENKLVVAFTTADTVGTRNTIKLAQKNNIPVVEIPYTPMHDNRLFAMELNGISTHCFLKYIEQVNQNEAVLREAVARLKTDVIPYGAMYILPNGTLLDLSTFENGHADLWAYLDERIPITSYPQYDIVNYLRDKGWRKANTKVGYIETQYSTAKQILLVEDILDAYPSTEFKFY